MKVWMKLLFGLCIAVMLAVVLFWGRLLSRLYLYETFSIPTSSMVPTTAVIGASCPMTSLSGWPAA